MASNPRGSDCRCNILIFTCFCQFYLFLFPILLECTLVQCYCGIFIELASSSIGQRAKRVPNLDDASRHKTIKIKKLRNLFKLNSMKAKLKQTTTVANYQPATHTREKCGEKTLNLSRNIRKFVAWQVATSYKFEEKRATKPKFVAQSRPTLYFPQLLPSSCNKASMNIYVARQVDHTRWKAQNIDPKTSNETMLHDTLKEVVSYFAAFTLIWVAGLPIVCYTFVVCFSFFKVLVSRISPP